MTDHVSVARYIARQRATEEAERRYPINGASTPDGATLVYARQQAFWEGALWAQGQEEA